MINLPRISSGRNTRTTASLTLLKNYVVSNALIVTNTIYFKLKE